MEDVEYILRIVLKARDEMAAVLAKARTQLRGFANDSKNLNTSLEALNKSMDKFNDNMDGVTDKLQAWRAVLRDAGGESKETAKSVALVGKQMEKSVSQTKAAIKSTEDYLDSIDALGKTFTKINKEFEKGKVSRKDYIAELDLIAKEYDKLSKKSDIGSELSRALRKGGEEARKVANGLIADNEKITATINAAVKAENEHRKALADKVIQQETLIKSANRLRDEYRELLKAEKRSDTDRQAAIIRLRQIGSELTAIGKQVDDASTSKLYTRWVADSKLAIDAINGVKGAKLAADKAIIASDKAAMKAREDSTRSQLALARQQVVAAKESARIEREGGTPAEIRALASSYKRLSGEFQLGSRQARAYANESERLSTSLRASVGDSDRGTSAFERLSATLKKTRDNTAGFDNQMRGLGILAAVVSIDQLISAAIALGGELVSLAGSAVMAGGALGGILAAGAAQALPVLGLLAGAVSRVKGVMDAFQQSQVLQRAQFTDAEKGGQKAIDQANTLANAHDAVSDANDRLAESRKALTQAQKDGTDQLEDLIYAEKAAALAAKGASLNVKEAQQALAEAIAGGASALEIQGRQQAVEEAELGASRAPTLAKRATGARQAAGGKVENLESVKNATKALADAEKAAKRAERGLDQAMDKADRAASTTMTAAANLNYLLSQMSPAERKLYEAVQRIYATYKRIFIGSGKKDGIYGTIIDAFTRAVDEADKILQMPKVIASITKLSGVIGANIDKVVKAVADPSVITQLTGIIDAASKNLGPLVDILIDLGLAFLNIAETANPAFQELIKYVGPLVEDFLKLTSDKGKMEDFFKSGEEHLESWLDLVIAIIGLFAALTGASAESGKTSIDDLTEKIKGWTDWISSHKEEVVAFFEDARKAAYSIGGVLENLATTLFKTFSAERVENFAKILNDTVIPAIAEVIDVIGKVTDKIAKMLENPVAAQVAKWALAIFLLSKIAAPLGGLLAHITRNFLVLGKVLFNVGKFFIQVAKHWREIIQVAKLFMAGVGGPIAIIGLLVAGVILLLHHFGRLDDVWRGIKDSFKIFLDAIQPALKSLKDAIEDVGIKAGSFSGALKFLQKVGQALADFIAKYLVETFKGMAKVLGGVAIILIRALTGVIKIFHGLYEIARGIYDVIFHMDFTRLLAGLEDVAEGIILIIGGIIEGLISAVSGIVEILLAPFKAAWDAVLDFFGVHSPSTLAMELGEAIIDGLVAGAKAAVNAVRRLPGWIWDKIEDGFRALGGAVRKAAGWLFDKWLDAVKAELRTYKKIATWVWDKIKEGFYGLGSAVRKVVSWIWDKFVDFIKLEIRGFKSIGTWIWEALSNSIHAVGSKLESLGKRVIDAVIKGIKAAPNAIRDAINWLLDKVPGGGAVKTALKVLPGDGFAEGGPVPGSGDGDTVVARLTPGEHVLTKQEVAAAGGHAAIFALRRLLGGGGQGSPFGYALGGVVDPRTGLIHGVGGGEIDYKAANKRAADARKEDAEDRKKALQNEREDYKKSGTERAETTRAMWNDILTTTRRAANDVEKQIRDMRVNTTRTFKRLARDISGAWSAMWFSLMKVSHEGLHYIGHETNKALSALGEKHINFGLAAPKAPSSGNEGGATTSTDTTTGGRFALGGFVGKQGQRGADRGLYPLGPGEAVLNYAHQAYVEPAMNAFYGHGLGALFGRVRGYHAGGPGQLGFAAGKFSPIPGMPNEEAASGYIDMIVDLIRRYKILITDAYDRDRSAGHKSPGHNVTGTAIDAVPGKGGSWDTIEAMGKWAVNKGMTVGYGAGVPGSQPWAGHGRGNHIHIELGGAPGAKVTGGGGGTVDEIVGKLVTPRGSQLARFVQSTIDKLVTAANKTVSSKGGGTGPDAVSSVSGANAAEKVFNFFTKDHNVSAAIAAGFAGVFQKESNFSTSVLNATGSGAQGLAQWLGGRLDALKKKPNWQSLTTQLNFVWEELMGPESAAWSAIKGATSPGQAARIIDSKYERSDKLLSAPAYAEAWYKKFAKGMAAGGMIPGPDGAPTPILAHAGEWVLNKGQQLRAAMMAGLSVPALRSMLGFHGGNEGAAGGTEVKDARGVAMVAPVATLKTIGEDIKDVWKGITEVARILKKIKTDAIKKGDADKTVAAYQSAIDLIGGAIGDLGIGAYANEVAARVTRAATRLKNDVFKVGKDDVVKKVMSGGDILKRELGSMNRYADDLVGEKSFINESLKKVNAKIKEIAGDKSISEKKRLKLIGQLEGQRTFLRGEQDRIDSEIADSVEQRFNKQVEIQQNAVDDIDDLFDKNFDKLDLSKRFAAAIGNVGAVEAINEQIAWNISQQADALEGQIAGMEAIGNTEGAEAIRTKVKDLRMQVFEKAQEALKEASEAIGRGAARRGAVLDLFSRMGDAMGTVGQGVATTIGDVGGIGGLGSMTRAQVARGRVTSAEQERAERIGLLGKAQAAGNVGLSEELIAEINELTVVIAENTKAEFEAKLAAVNSAHDYKQSMFDLDMQLVDLNGTISGSVDQQKKSDLLKAKGDDLLAKGNELTGLLAELTPGTQTYMDLQRAIKENEIATLQNTIALNEMTGAGNAPATYTSTAWEWFRSAFLTGTGKVMPAYVPPVMQTASTIGSSSTNSSTVNGGTTINTSIEINEAGGPIDVTKIANTVVFAQATAPN